ncbi:hypothetical protein TNIN_183191 [Trichonephila inaurata madagascariensis]|uniref:Uncharacterized protein n=1 Tax=Trichonephila inaurata madagascariensis TaxID=2747483 RepID=A0A8X6IF93_9ARAC|nr:hypothetical protein TNIN_183191 [Trichonephila inaurata madagascariensis]
MAPSRSEGCMGNGGILASRSDVKTHENLGSDRFRLEHSFAAASYFLIEDSGLSFLLPLVQPMIPTFYINDGNREINLVKGPNRIIPWTYNDIESITEGQTQRKGKKSIPPLSGHHTTVQFITFNGVVSIGPSYDQNVERDRHTRTNFPLSTSQGNMASLFPNSVRMRGFQKNDCALEKKLVERLIN